MFEKINKIGKPLARLIKKKGSILKSIKLEMKKKLKQTIQKKDLKDPLRGYTEQLYVNKMDNLEERHKFFEKYNLPRLNQEEIENMDRPITSMEIETIIKNLLTNKRQRPDGFIGEFYQRFRELIYILLIFFQKLYRRKTPKLILQGHHHPDTKTRQI